MWHISFIKCFLWKYFVFLTSPFLLIEFPLTETAKKFFNFSQQPPGNLNKRLFFFFFNLPCHVACGILVLQPGIKPWPFAVTAWSPDHWTAREFPKVSVFDYGNLKIMKQLWHSKNDHVLLLWNMETYLGFGIFSWLAIFKKNYSVNKFLMWKYEIIGYII